MVKNGMSEDVQIKSKQRVTNHGEVFTGKREINAMLDMVKQETERLDSRFLEPACGTGNFLVEILRRKLAVLKDKYAKNQADYEHYGVIAASSIYGVDLLPDNVLECQERLNGIFVMEYTALFSVLNQQCLAAIKYLFSKNILCGDALNMRTENGKPIVFSEWAMVGDNKMQRRDFTLSDILEANKKSPQLTLMQGLMKYDRDAGTFIPNPVREYPLVPYWEIMNYE